MKDASSVGRRYACDCGIDLIDRHQTDFHNIVAGVCVDDSE